MRRGVIDPFMIAIAVVVCIAYFLPYPGTKESPFHLNEIANAGVSLIFLLYGVQLGPEKLRAGLTNTRLHLVIHASTFVLFPLLLILLKPLFHTYFLQQLWLPFFFLAALPSTISSSVVMVSIAGGNIPAAIFNASISSMLGVFITPLWMSIYLKQTGNIELGSIIIKLLLQVLLPVIIGLLLHKKFGQRAEANNKKLKLFDQSVILLIIYCSFAESFYEGVFKNFDAVYLAEILLMVTALLFIVYGIITLITKALGFEKKDRITATFCGSKKSLVHGSVMSKVLFANAANTGLILLPLMIFHATQLFVISIIAGKMQRDASKEIAAT